MSPAVATFDVRQALLDAARSELAEHGRPGVSLRAVARRAGVSHAAPKHHFGDRAGLLTAVAAQGFHDLTDALSTVAGGATETTLTSMGQVYFDYAQAHPALFEMMFAPAELNDDDSDFVTARRRAIDVLAALGSTTTPHVGEDVEASPLTLISWALVHGLCVLSRDGALGTITATESTHLAHQLLGLYAHHVDLDALSHF
ncbi:TetR/AcrR family transcriptional regulator [Mycobacterium sp. NPDC006124]|uniref:TetR/AcrR family transcriptional regulator n=1 Tax=Mycobacterium sp. NPDC006124 TaxID=3156729 RepID=UPI0033B755E7